MRGTGLPQRIGHEALHILDFDQQPHSIHRANAGDRLEGVIAG
jgi:hypothetical protein